MTLPNQDDVELALKIVDAMKEGDAAVRKEKWIIAGQLLAEAHKFRPAHRVASSSNGEDVAPC